MTEITDIKPENAETPENPFFDFIDKNHKTGSIRELIGNAFVGDGGVNSWDLPEDPEKLKEVLNAAVDYAVAKKGLDVEAK